MSADISVFEHAGKWWVRRSGPNNDFGPFNTEDEAWSWAEFWEDAKRPTRK